MIEGITPSPSLNGVTSLHVSTVHRPDDTRIYRRECRGLAKHGARVALAAPGKPIHSLSGVELLPLPVPKTRPGRVGLQQTLFRLVRDRRPDILHIHDPELLPLAVALARYTKAVIYDVHEYTPGSVLDKPYIPKLLRKPISHVVRIVERSGMRQVGVVFAEESYPAAYDTSLRQVIVRNFPTLDDFTDLTSDVPFECSDFAVGYVGGVSVDRGLPVTLHALSILNARGLRVHLHCVGPLDAASQALAPSLVRRLGLTDQVHFYGRLAGPDAWQVLRRTSVGLAILRDTPNYRTSLPTKILEYAALGLPVIASDFPLYKEYVETRLSCGICVDPNKPEQVASAIRKLASEESTRLDFGTSGRAQIVREYNWEQELRRLALFYQSCLE